jgi:hypothetical protein
MVGVAFAATAREIESGRDTSPTVTPDVQFFLAKWSMFMLGWINEFIPRYDGLLQLLYGYRSG